MNTMTFTMKRPLVILTLLAVVLAFGTLSAKAEDSDYDGLDDYWEYIYFASYSEDGSGDPDGDGLSNLYEHDHGLNPTFTDSDSDGLSDSYEIFIWPSNPLNPDTDGDQMIDGWENATMGDWRATTANANDDLDNDGWPNIEEFCLGSHPNDADSHPTGSTNWYFSNIAGDWVSGQPHLTWENYFPSATYIKITRSINGGAVEEFATGGQDTEWTDTSGFTSCCSGGYATYRIVAWYIVYYQNHDHFVYLGEAPNDGITFSW